MYENKTVGVIIPAAGSGSRMKMDIPKQFNKINGIPMLAITVRKFAEKDEVDEIVIASGNDQIEQAQSVLVEYGLLEKVRIVEGGKTRQESVKNALEILDCDLVLVHDCARPYVSSEVIDRVIEKANLTGAAICVVPVKDTIRRADETLKRDELFAVQTPQGFETKVLKEAMEKAEVLAYSATDEAGLVEHFGVKVALVDGDNANIKITTREDLPMETAVGIGYDIHRLVEGRKLILGGVEIPYEKGLLGHSDADVLIHAMMDAMLGAAGLGDIGIHFPDNDEKYKGISSVKLLEKVRDMVKDAGYSVSNIDIVLIAQKPKISPYSDMMKNNISKTLGIDKQRVNIKGTTMEGLGPIGSGEGISCQAICCLSR